MKFQKFMTLLTRRFHDTHQPLEVKKRACMVHDYNLPFGPWGQEQTVDQIKEHSTLCANFELFCASQHLTEFVEKWGGGASSRGETCKYWVEVM